MFCHSVQWLPVHSGERHFQCGRNCYALQYVDMHVPEYTCYKMFKPLVDDHLNAIFRVVIKEGFYCRTSISNIMLASNTC